MLYRRSSLIRRIHRAALGGGQLTIDISGVDAAHTVQYLFRVRRLGNHRAHHHAEEGPWLDGAYYHAKEAA